MKLRTITWIVGTVLTASLLMSAPAFATNGGKVRIPAAKRYHAAQIADRDVVLAGNSGMKGGRLARIPALENGRRVLVPNPDTQRRVVMPNPDAQRQVVVPNPDAQRQVVLPNPSAD